MFDLRKPCGIARVHYACAATLVAASALMSGGHITGSLESRMHDQLNQLLRVFIRLVRLKASDRELQEAERIRKAQVHCYGRQPSELSAAAVRPPLVERCEKKSREMA